MIKKILRAIRRQLLKIDWIKLEVEAYRLVQEKKRHHEDWAKLMHSGQTLRDHKTSATITDDEVIVEYIDGRMIGQRHVTPNIIRPFGMKRR